MVDKWKCKIGKNKKHDLMANVMIPSILSLWIRKIKKKWK